MEQSVRNKTCLITLKKYLHILQYKARKWRWLIFWVLLFPFSENKDKKKEKRNKNGVETRREKEMLARKKTPSNSTLGDVSNIKSSTGSRTNRYQY